MKNFILGAAVVAVLGGAGYALAAGGAISLVDHSTDKNVLKYYDSDANVVCYVSNAYGGGISCLKKTPATTAPATTKLNF